MSRRVLASAVTMRPTLVIAMIGGVACASAPPPAPTAPARPGEAARSTTITAAQLRIILRSNASVAATQASGRHVTARPFSSDAQWLLAADLPTIIRLDIGADELGMTADQAWRTAVGNMKKPATELVTAASEGFIVYQDDYAPSALLDPAALDQAVRSRFPQRTGTLLAACPEENIVLYTLGGSAEVATLRNAITTVATRSERPLSAEVMEWTGTTWRAAAP
jgi:hypothetical protein